MTRLGLLPLILWLALGQAALAQSSGFGNAQDVKQPVEVTADQLQVDQRTGLAVFTGNVLIGQGGMRLSADKVTVTYAQGNAQRISALKAEGNVTLSSGSDAAEARTADYNVERGTVILTGDVLLTQGANVLAGQTVTVDLATGTGDLAFEVLKRHPDAQVVGADIAAEMMEVGRARAGGDRIEWVVADATDLPFEAGSFDAVTHGYLLRNVADIPATLAEQFRVLRPGGWVAALETSPAPDNVLKPFSSFYIHRVMPQLAKLIADRPEAYAYLSSSTKAFHTPDEVADLFAEAGFVNIGHETHMFGTLATHWAMKPVD